MLPWESICVILMGQEGLSPDEIGALLDEDTPQQLLVSAFRKQRR